MKCRVSQEMMTTINSPVRRPIQSPRDGAIHECGWARVLGASVTAFIVGLVLPVDVNAQSSSLYQQDLPVLTQPGAAPPARLGDASWLFRELPVPQQIAVEDLVTIRVDHKAQTFAEGSVERRKVTSIDAILQDWIRLVSFDTVKPAPQADGDPRIRGAVNQLYRSEGDLETRESVKFDITAHVVDIRPNGNIVLEAHEQIRNNDEVWEYSLSGECARKNIGPDNVVLSKHIASLRLQKNERGAVRDSYKRGWVLKLRDRFRWF